MMLKYRDSAPLRDDMKFLLTRVNFRYLHSRSIPSPSIKILQNRIEIISTGFEGLPGGLGNIRQSEYMYYMIIIIMIIFNEGAQVAAAVFSGALIS